MEELKLLLMFLTVSGYSYVLQPGLTVTQTAGLDRDHQTEIRSDQLGGVSRPVEEEEKIKERTKMAPQMFSIILRGETKKEELSVADRVTEKNKDMERKKDEQTQETKEILTGDMTKTINSLDRQIEEDTTANEEFKKSDQMAKLKRENAEEERESRLVAGINLSDDTGGEMMWTVNQEHLEKKAGEEEKEDHMVVSDLTLPATIQIITQSQNPSVHHHNVPESLLVAPAQVSSHPPTPHARVSPYFLHPSVTLPKPTTVNHIPVSTVLPGESRAISLFEDLLTEVLQSQLKQNELEVKAGPNSEDVMGKNILFKPARQELQTAVAQPKHMTEYIAMAQEATAKPKEITFITKDLNEPKTTPKSNENNPTVELKPIMTLHKPMENDTKFAARRNKASPPQPQTTKPLARPGMRPTKLSRKSGNKTKAKKRKKDKKTQKPPEKEVIMPTPFPYFKDNYCPPECACYGRVVQCSDKGVDKVPYGIPYNARYILLMNNHINSIQLDLLNEYVSMEFLVLSNNRLIDGTIEGAFEGVPALKRLYLDRNLLGSIPTDLPMSLEELRLDNNRLTVMSEAAWARCPGLLVLSLSNNSLGNVSDSLPTAVLSPLRSLRTLNLDYNQLTSVPLGLPLSIKELYLKGNLIEQFRGGAFNGISELMVLDVSTNRLTNKGLPRESLLNATQLESLNLEGNRLKQVPRHLPRSLKTLNLEGNLISSIKKVAFGTLKNLEHLGLARNKIVKVAPGAFRTLPVLHQLDLCHNAMRQVPRQLPEALHSVALNNNKIQSVPRDAFCWGTKSLSGLVRVQLEHNLIDMGKLDAQAFRCLRGFQVVHFY